jgi:hypothetical protein
MSSLSIILPLERTRWYTDRDGVVATTKRYDETIEVAVDWTDQLATSETVSSVAYDASGVTTSGAALVSPVSTVTVGRTGDLEITATLSTGRILQRLLRFVEEQTADEGRESDY